MRGNDAKLNGKVSIMSKLWLLSVHRNMIGAAAVHLWTFVKASCCSQVLKLSHNQELAKCQSQLQMRSSASTIRNTTVFRIQPRTWKRDDVEYLQTTTGTKYISDSWFFAYTLQDLFCVWGDFLLEICSAWMFYWMQPCQYESNFGNHMWKLFLYLFWGKKIGTGQYIVLSTKNQNKGQM